MKKIKLEKKLSLSKETIAKLNNDQLNTVRGGTVGSCACPSDYFSCNEYCHSKPTGPCGPASANPVCMTIGTDC